jgi:hypothetical protein
MNAGLQQGAAHPIGGKAILSSGVVVQEPANVALASNQRKQSCERLKQELIWVLISILLFLFLVTSYCFWAKLESAWPIAR